MDSTICTNCGVNKENCKYSPDSRHKNGLQSQCRQCQSSKSKEYYKKNPTKKAEECARHYKKNKKELLRKQKIYNQRPETRRKHNVRGAAWRALQIEVLIKQPCEICGEPKVQMHHKDYSKPLDVDWLCNECHNKLRRSK